jgi:nucleotide sugar dehydrogenase
LARENGVWNLGSSEAAEFAKLAETTYRDVNIGLANQFAVFSAKSGIDIHAVIEACNSQPFSKIHQPGIAVGGHCIPVYPHFYLQGDPGATIVQAARQANINMPRYAVDLLENALSTLRGKEVVILGLAYRGGVKEHAFSGTWPLVTEISKRGGVPKVHDPLYSHQELMNLGLTPAQGLGEADALILQTNHKEYLYLRAEDLPKAEVFLDGRNFAPEGIRNSSLKYINLGHPVEHSSGQ